ncbi:thiamine transporter membrane protein [Raoultella planticola]|uniref:Thiamine transporter membrane protein n=1 Tax=Raoultella planticola TaxID=575 RepID=A0A485B022_RAOPL|nr:thiamine transporter membrane protein [Raoultella planticola]
MATRRQPLNIGWLAPGLTAAALLVAVALAAFLALWGSAPEASWRSIFSDSYLWHVIRFSFWQAFLSALFSVVPAIFLARALYRRRFPGRTLLLRLCAMTLILPVLVAVFGILSVYGRQGWLATLFNVVGWQWDFSPYGLQGILLAHVFFNMPMATRLLLQALEEYPRRAAPDRRPAGHARLPLFPSGGVALATAANSPGRGTDLYALLRQLCHRAVARRRPTGHND